MNYRMRTRPRLHYRPCAVLARSGHPPIPPSPVLSPLLSPPPCPALACITASTQTSFIPYHCVCVCVCAGAMAVALPDGAIFAALLALRIANALSLRTFFQPDEFFQSLEVAVDLAYGSGSNAYITWEWKKRLRSSLHPFIFAAVYRGTLKVASTCGLSLSTMAELLLLAPKVTQALFAALLDWHTWKLAEKAYGRGSRTAFGAVRHPPSLSLSLSLSLSPHHRQRQRPFLMMSLVHRCV